MAVLLIVLAGVLIYVLSSGTQPGKSHVVSDKSVPTDSGNSPAAAKHFQPEHRSAPRAPVDSASNGTVASAEVQPSQEVPALEPEIREALGDILNNSSEGLVEVTRNGVTSIDLQGRFQTAPVATVDESGNVQITDYTHLPRAQTRP